MPGKPGCKNGLMLFYFADLIEARYNMPILAFFQVKFLVPF
jgi:hypothetical protein